MCAKTSILSCQITVCRSNFKVFYFDQFLIEELDYIDIDSFCEDPPNLPLLESVEKFSKNVEMVKITSGKIFF
jgi:hypothetical protein